VLPQAKDQYVVKAVGQKDCFNQNIYL